MAFLLFLLRLEGVIPAVTAYLATVLSFIFGRYLPGLPPELYQGALTLLSIILTAFVAYKANPQYQQYKARNSRK
jgi:hypothetical protein